MKVDPSKVNLAEKDIEDWLYENPEKLRFGWGISHNVKEWIGRQIIVPSGIIDLLGIFTSHNRTGFVVVEIKNTEFTQSSILQVCRYASDIQCIALDYSVETNDRFFDDVYKGVVAKGEPSNQLMFEANSVNVQLLNFYVNYEMVFDEGYEFTSEFKKENKNIIDNLKYSKDFRKYIDDYVPDVIEDFIKSIPDEEED